MHLLVGEETLARALRGRKFRSGKSLVDDKCGASALFFRETGICLVLIALFAFTGCAGGKPKPTYEFDPGKGRCLVYGRLTKGEGGGGYVVFERSSPHKEIQIKTWKLSGVKGHFLMELDSGSYVVRQAKRLRVAPGSNPMSGMPSARIGEGKEDRSENTQYFDKHIHLPAGKIVYVGDLSTREYGISIDFDKRSVDDRMTKEYPHIDFKAAEEIFPQ